LKSAELMLIVRPPSRLEKAGAGRYRDDIRPKPSGNDVMSGFFNAMRLLLLGLTVLAVAGCDSSDGGTLEKRSGASGDRTKRDATQGLGGRNREEGSLFGPGGLFGTKANQKESTGTGVAVNAFLWRASLDTINFIPLVSADPFGGVIITDWYTPAESPSERMKVQVTILDRELRADGVRVSVFKQQQAAKAGGSWVDAQVDPRTNTEIENAILTRARQLRIAQGG
jgi:Domain of unknown function (DUF3576)